MDRWDELERLGRLRDDGLLSNEEFETEKRRLLASPASAPDAPAAPAPAPEPAAAAPAFTAVAPTPAEPLAAARDTALPVEPDETPAKKRGLTFLAISCAVILGGVGIGWAYSRTATGNYKPLAAETPAKAKSVEDAPAKYTFQSQVSGANFAPLAELPTVKPYGEDQDGYCSQPIAAATAGGRSAEKRGWRVIQETPYQGMDAVLMVRGFDPGTSGHCFPKDANLAFFEGGKLLGTLSASGKNGIGINTVESIGGRLRVWDDLMPVGQIDLTSRTLTFAQVTGTDDVCGGKYRVPTTFGKPYSRARDLLGRTGWNPGVTTEEEGGDSRTEDYRSRFPETDSCAGTGYAYCAFAWQANNGAATLQIVTAGEDDDPRVVSYNVSCDGQSSE